MVVQMEEEKVTVSAFLMQGLSSIIIAVLAILTGMVNGWPSYTMELLKSNSTVLSAPMTTSEISLFGSLLNVGGLIATPFCGYAMDKLGRKYTTMLFGLPFLIAWWLISCSTSVYVVLIAVAFAGVGSAGQAVSTVYISEICQDSIRGALLTTIVIGFFLGLLLSNILGAYLSYYKIVHIFLIVSIAYVLMIFPLKESPVYLIQNGKIEEAKSSLAFYRRINRKSQAVEKAIQNIYLQLDRNLSNSSRPDGETNKTLLNKPSAVSKPISPWKFLKNSESSLRALAIILILIILSTFMGVRVLVVYSESLFKEAVPTMSPNTGRIILSSVLLVSGVLCAFIIDRFGRKFLVTWTMISAGVFNVILGTQLQMHWAPHWFTAFIIYLYNFILNMGYSVPSILSVEVFLPEVRGICNTFCMACMWIAVFILLVIFIPLVDIWGVGVTFYIFSAFSFLTAGYSHFYLPETKGLSVDKIQLLFMKNR